MNIQPAERRVIYLHAGEHFISKEPEIISTVLGSCISVVLYSRQYPVCGITHSQLPSCKYDRSHCTICKESYRYVDCSIIKLVQKMQEYNIHTKCLEAKVFGGASVIKSNSSEEDNVGSQNAQMALDVLVRERIKVIVRDTGGSRGRKLFFFTDTKEVFIKKLSGNRSK